MKQKLVQSRQEAALPTFASSQAAGQSAARAAELARSKTGSVRSKSGPPSKAREREVSGEKSREIKAVAFEGDKVDVRESPVVLRTQKSSSLAKAKKRSQTSGTVKLPQIDSSKKTKRGQYEGGVSYEESDDGPYKRAYVF